jgi:type I restriction enzyme, R subunit
MNNSAHNQDTVGRVSSPGVELDDFDHAPFTQRGGLGKAHQLVGEQLPKLLDELNEVLAA